MGVRISWLMSARKADLAREASSASVAGGGELELALAALGHVTADEQ
jgi:hypothetical protein